MRPALAALAALLLSGPGGGAAQATGPQSTAGTPFPPPAVTELRRDVLGALDHYRPPSAQWSVLVTSLDIGDTLFALEPHRQMAPASNMKLFTSAAALSALGPDFRFLTYLVSDAPVVDGVLEGDLVLYGTGDPGISDRFFPDKLTVFRTLARQLAERGVRVVAGDLVGDASFLPGPLRPAGWADEDLNDHFAAAVSALSFNENVVSFRLVAADRAGDPPEVHTIPERAGLPVENHGVTVADRPRYRIGIVRERPDAPVRIEGSIRRGARDVWRQLTVPDPPAFALSVFRGVLEEEGIAVRGGDRVVSDPAESRVSGARISAPSSSGTTLRILGRHRSPPLRTYLAEVNKHSNNLYAELIFRTTGRLAGSGGDPGGAAAAVARHLSKLGVDLGATHQVDGSGLSEENRTTAATLVQLLERVAASPLWEEFWHTLPVAGRRRELGRMYRTAAAGNLRAKTGTIEDASALTGVVRSRDQERLVFSILVNGVSSTTRAKRVENLIGARLARFTRGPGAARVAAAAVPDPRPPLEVPDRYRVRPGESFSTIARRHGVTLDELLRLNPDVEPRRLRAGQWILIPPPPGAPPGD